MKVHFKRVFRGWLPQQPSTIQKLKQHSTPIAAGVIIALLSISGFIVYFNAVSVYSASTAKPLPIITSTNNTTSEQDIVQATSSPSPSPTPQSTPTSEDNTLLTEEEALAIAKPVIERYAQENNRTITGFKVCVSPTEPGNPYLIWIISAGFSLEELPQPRPIKDENGTVVGSVQWGTVGYSVSISAITGQVLFSAPISIC
jgi:hypothetical protein